MHEMRLGAIETRFAEIIWDNAPLASGQLVKLCQEELNWKKPTTYTVLRKLCERGIFQNQDGMVTVCISRDEFYSRQSREYVQESFAGSLPAFLAAFTARKKLTNQEIEQLDISEEDILEQHPMVLKVSGLNYGDLVTDYVQFVFDETGDEHDRFLCEVEVILPKSVTKDSVREEIEKNHFAPTEFYSYTDLFTGEQRILRSNSTYAYWASDETLGSYYPGADQLRLWEFYESLDKQSHPYAKYQSVMSTHPMCTITFYESGDGNSYVVDYDASTLSACQYKLYCLKELEELFAASK